MTPTAPVAPARITEPVVSLRGITVEAGGRRLLEEVDLDLARGTVVAVVGPNGAGKTTLLDVISRTVPFEGELRVERDLRIARVAQGSPFPASLTVAEVLALASKDRPVEDAASRFGLLDHLDKRVEELSTGMRRILDLAVASARPHDVLLLDEPSSGLAAAEVEHLGAMIRRHRDENGATVLVVEHNRALVEIVADEVVGLAGGRVAEQSVDAGGVATPVPSLRPVLTAVAAAGIPVSPTPRHEVSTWTKLRLGLREFAAGMSSVLILGILNRVMKVELGISLAVVAAVLASYNLAAPIALAIGHRSDQRPILGRHRSPYIIGGAVVTAAVLAAAPHLADRLASGVTPLTAAVTIASFVAMGAGMYGSGAVYFALLADLTPREERAHAASVVYLMLMGGIVSGAGLAAAILDADGGGRYSLFAIVGILVVVLNVAAVWGLDPKEAPDELPERVGTWSALREVCAIRAARQFFVFMVAATFFLFLQQAVLEPFGGDVLGLSVRATTAFNAVQTIGVLVGMAVTGRGIADRAGHKRTALIGLVGSAVAFGGLAVAATAGAPEASWLAVLAVGLTTGLLNVAVLALMMTMSVPERIALFMGAWTVSHAVANGLATAGGGVIQELAQQLTGRDAFGYGFVFLVQAIGLLACVPLLRRINTETFAREVAAESARRSAIAMGWLGQQA